MAVMAWLKKKADPISDRERALTEEIAQFEAQIKQLESQLQRDESHPRLRSTAVPQGATVAHSPAATAHVPPPAPSRPQEPIFEDVGQSFLKARGEVGGSPELFNELGVRKYDLPALWHRIQQNFRGPSTTNPRLVSFLAAGRGLQGLQPLRYEKRVARNRFLAFVIALFLVLLGTVWVFVQRH
jgi:hypothetical protein